MYPRFILSFILISISFSNLNTDQNEIDYIEIGAHNIRQNNEGEYLVDIYANNKEAVAGVQFELLGNDFSIISVDGGRSKNSGFIFHTGLKKGIVLAFSMEGKTIAPTHSLNKRINTLFTIKVRKNTKESSIFDVKTLIAAPKGIKLESQFIPIMID
jgi:hypothetical protein